MIKLLTGWLVVICFTAIAEETSEFPVFSASETESILDKTGQKITVRGMVSEARKSKGGTHFISFENSDFYLVTFKSDLKAFKGEEPAVLYRNKHLAVTGVISVFKNKPQMKLNHPDMVKIISEDEPIPAQKIKKKRIKPTKKPAIKTPKKAHSEQKKKTPPVDSKKYFK